VLGKYEAFSNAGPGEEVDCVAVYDGLGWTNGCISMWWKVGKYDMAYRFKYQDGNFFLRSGVGSE